MFVQSSPNVQRPQLCSPALVSVTGLGFDRTGLLPTERQCTLTFHLRLGSCFLSPQQIPILQAPLLCYSSLTCWVTWSDKCADGRKPLIRWRIILASEPWRDLVSPQRVNSCCCINKHTIPSRSLAKECLPIIKSTGLFSKLWEICFFPAIKYPKFVEYQLS